MSNKSQSMTVWAVFTASIVAFMGIGLVDPILPEIAEKLHAAPALVTLLFTSYSAVMSLAMLVTGALSSRWGVKRTLMVGMILIAGFAFACSVAPNVETMVGLRGFWGLGNALFIATALAAIVSFSNQGASKGVILYETAIGLGFSVGPLLGGILGSFGWPWPFVGVGVLMGITAIILMVSMPKTPVDPAQHRGFKELFHAFKHLPLVILGVGALLYNFGFFTLLAYGPFVMHLDALGIGLVYFGWGILVALTSIFLAPAMKKRWGTLKTLYGTLAVFVILLGTMGLFWQSQVVTIVVAILTGGAIGTCNTLLTTAVMHAAPTLDRSAASAAYNFLRFIGSAIAPILAAALAAALFPGAPFVVAGIIVLVALGLFFFMGHHLHHVDHTPGH